MTPKNDFIRISPYKKLRHVNSIFLSINILPNHDDNRFILQFVKIPME